MKTNEPSHHTLCVCCDGDGFHPIHGLCAGTGTSLAIRTFPAHTHKTCRELYHETWFIFAMQKLRRMNTISWLITPGNCSRQPHSLAKSVHGLLAHYAPRTFILDNTSTTLADSAGIWPLTAAQQGSAISLQLPLVLVHPILSAYQGVLKKSSTPTELLLQSKLETKTTISHNPHKPKPHYLQKNTYTKNK